MRLIRAHAGALKMNDLKMTDKENYGVWKMRDWKMTDKYLGSGKCRTTLWVAH